MKLLGTTPMHGFAYGVAIGLPALLVVYATRQHATRQDATQRECNNTMIEVRSALAKDRAEAADLMLNAARSKCGKVAGEMIGQLQIEITAKRQGAAPAKTAEHATPEPTPVAAPRPASSSPTWRTIPRPGVDTPNTSAARLDYMRDVLLTHPGEPKLDPLRGRALLEKVKASLVKQASIPAASVKVNVGDQSGGLIVAKGTLAKLSHRGEILALGACSEALLATAILDAGLSPADFSLAGMPGILCNSDHCTAIFNMRPTSTGGGLYAGEVCLSMDDMITIATKH